MKHHRVCRSLVLAGCLFALLAGPSEATRYVAPNGGNIAPYTNWAMAARSIQAAVSATTNGEVVLVTNGTYVVSHTVGMGICKLRSVNGPAVTTIDANGSTGCVAIAGTDASIEGFTITGGRDSYAAGIYLYGGALVKNCVIVSNVATEYGGGIYVVDGRILDCDISRNTASNFGGGIYFAGSGFASNCTVRENRAVLGAGILFEHGGTQRDCRIFLNSASDSGGGAYMNVGGKMENCLVYANEAAAYGGGVFCGVGGHLQNCTLAANYAEQNGGGLYCSGGGTIVNSIIYVNATDPGLTNQNYRNDRAGMTYTYCCSAPQPPGLSNIGDDPDFVDFMNDNYHLRPTSPCIDWSGATATAPAADLDNVPRPVDGNASGLASADLGCYEYVPGRLTKDYDFDMLSDLTVFDPAAGAWYIRRLSGSVICFGTNWGFAGVTTVPGDFFAGYDSDLAVWDGATGNWYIRTVKGQIVLWAFNWGFPPCVAASADFNGDQITDLGVFDPTAGNWYIRKVSDHSPVLALGTNWGFPGCQPVPADYNADGTAELAVYDPAAANWYVRTLQGATLAWATQWGFAGCIPVPGDFDGDGRADLALYDPNAGTWYIRTLAGQVLALGSSWGFAGAVPVSLDANGDGKSELAVYYPVNGTWYIRTLQGQVLAWGANWGSSTMAAVRP